MAILCFYENAVYVNENSIIANIFTGSMGVISTNIVVCRISRFLTFRHKIWVWINLRLFNGWFTAYCEIILRCSRAETEETKNF